MISIRRTRSEKLLSLKVKPKSQDETVGVDPGEESESMEVLGSNRSVLGGGGLFGYLSNIANYPMALPYKTLLIIKLLNYN